MTLAVRPAASLAALVAVGGFLAAPATAGTAVARITSPAQGSTVTGSTVTVKGTYSASATVREARVALCRLNSAGACTAYLSDPATGGFISNYRSLPATLSPTDQVSGSFSLTGKQLPAGSYKAASFLVTSDTPKGPPMQVVFTLKAATDNPPPATKGFLTIGFGRSQWSAATGTNCDIVPAGARTLQQNLADLQARGLSAQGGVIVNRTEPTTRTCYQQQLLQPSWSDLNLVRDTYAMTGVSQGMNYADMTKMTTDEQRYQESGATLPILNNKGFTRAWGMFYYPNDKMDAAANRVVTQYFAFGRKYGTSINNRSEVMTYPYLVKTISVMGGRCNNKALACYSMPMKNDKRTVPPSRLGRMMSPGVDQWASVQFYRIVEGAYGRMGSNGIAWDCTSADWRNRWTSHPEMYCHNSFLEALDSRKNQATSADAVTVAEAWGRRPG